MDWHSIGLFEWFSSKLETSRGRKHNLQPIEGLRGFAIFLVFVVHFVVIFSPWLPKPSFTYSIANILHADGRIGVFLFFLLSGFLVYGMLIDRPRPFAQFFYRRMQRIYPPYFVVLLIYIGLSYAFPAESRIPAQPIQAALYILKNLLLLPGLFPILPIISVTWTLSFVVAFYLLMPLLIAVFRLRSWQPGSRIGFFLLLSAVIVILYLVLGGNGESIRFIMFFAGAALYDTLKTFPALARVKGLGLPALAVGFIILPFLPETSSGAVARAVLLFITLFLFCLESFSNSQGLSARWLSWTPLRWFGNMSYSYFLIHGLALNFIALLLIRLLPAQWNSPWVLWAGLPIAFLITLVPAFILYLTVELPYSLLPSRSRLSTSTQDISTEA